MVNKANPYFQSNYFGAEEQTLADALTIESIQIHGIGVKYIPREDVALDELYGEDKLSAFNDVFEIEMYIKNFEQFGGDGDFLSKFGLEIRDEVILQVSKTRWEEDIANGSPPIPRPREGDLIYFPFSDRLFEIHFVEHEEVFYQLGKLFTYEMRCKLFEYSSQRFDTGLEEIDKVEDYANQTILTLDTGTLDYTVGEQVYQGASLATSTASGEVISWNSGTKELVVGIMVGTFDYGYNIIGDTSGADWTYTDQSFQERNDNDPISDNVTIETEYDSFDVGTKNNRLS
jgi:hypothetical protein